MKRTLASTVLLVGTFLGFTGHAEAFAPSNSEVLLGRIVKADDNGVLVQDDHGQSMKLQLTKDTNIVCVNGSEAKLITGQGMEEQAASKDPAALKGVVGSPDEAARTDLARGPEFVAKRPDCHFQSGDLVRIEASDKEAMTTITRLASGDNNRESHIATERDEDPGAQ